LLKEIAYLKSAAPSYLFHEYLAEFNAPMAFGEFAAQLDAHGLRYVGEAGPRRAVVELEDAWGLTPEGMAGRWLDRVGPYPPLLVGTALMTFGALLPALFPYATADVAPLLVASALLGTGFMNVQMTVQNMVGTGDPAVVPRRFPCSHGIRPLADRANRQRIHDRRLRTPDDTAGIFVLARREPRSAVVPAPSSSPRRIDQQARRPIRSISATAGARCSSSAA
jgi:hypothetical protein